MINISDILMLFLCIGLTRMSSQSAILPTTESAMTYFDALNEFTVEENDKDCQCIKYKCGCCRRIEWDFFSLNGILCANASYLEDDYGISITVTYNDFTIINETVSARDPPPICIGEDIMNSIEVEVCLHIYDININFNQFHVCFEILGKISKIKTPSIKLGCVNTNLQKQLNYLKNYTFPKWLRPRNNEIHSVIMI